MKVLKFGGSSMGSAENIRKVAAIIRSAGDEGRCAVVVSAMQGTTDKLIEAGRTAERGDEHFGKIIDEIEQRHRETMAELFPNGVPAGLGGEFDSAVRELTGICEGVRLVGELSTRTLDRILSFGELVSSRIFSEFLTSEGVDNRWTDSRELTVTDSNFGAAAVDFAKTNERTNQFFTNGNSDLYILPGFIARDEKGAITTLGRGGSDYTAAILAAAVEADILEIWTDVSGMMTADPRFVRSVRQISHITYREAMELSHFGAKVIYPPTIQPVMAKGIPVLVKNTFAPDDHGTLIESETDADREIIRGITSIDKIAVINLEGSGMVGIPGFSKRLFDALSRAQINVILITQSSSEHSISVAIEEQFGELARAVVDREFEHEIAVGKIEPLRVETGLSILALVGDNMKQHTGVSGRMFSALGQNGINIHAIAQGSSERNISTIVSHADVRKAVNTLHEEFFSDGSKQVNLFIAGVGTVGGRLFEQLRLQHDFLLNSLRLNVRVIALANSRTSITDDEGIDLQNWQDQLRSEPPASAGGRKSSDSQVDPRSSDEPPAHAGGSDLSDLIIGKNLRNSIFVDATANSDIVEIYPRLLKRSVSIVACNKVACSSEYEKYARLKDLAREYNTNFLFETNVGAGLPVINTLNDLLRSGDRVHRIEAVLSGTLNFVFNYYDGSRSFSSVVRQAQAEGFTEPDPRLDLSGTDVARKILILAREAGYKLEMSDIRNEPFLPASCLEGNVEGFYAEMEKNEEHFRSLLTNASSEGKILKYIATFDNGRASVGLQSISSDHNFANLSGKDNAVLFYTDRYSEQPLVIKGAGAGADVTAAGVFADIIRAAR
jgi:aspartokinase/homoserine dehydrogenase 1